MKKILFRTALVLAALTACNKETDIQTPVTPAPVEEAKGGKVTLTFKATVGEDTRTAYVNDKTGTWEADDRVSVCVTDGSGNFQIVTFTTADGETFSGEVEEGFGTIVSGIYPQNEAYATFPGDYFDVTGDGDVVGLYLANVLEMGAASDQGTLVPMVGSYDADTQTMSFHHVCGALKVTLTGIPADASIFTFHTNNQQLVFDFPLTDDGRIELGTPVEGNDDTNISFCFTAGSETTRSFYIPIPDGSLASGAYVTLENEDGELLYKKVLSTAQTFDRNVIKRLPETACWTRNDNWDAYYYGTYKSSSNNNFYKGVATLGTNSPFQYSVFSDSIFNNKYDGSVAEYLSSQDFATTVGKLTKSYTGNMIFGFSSLSPGTYHVVIYGLDEDLHFTGEYNCVEIVYPAFSVQEDWSISVSENHVTYSVPTGTTWQYISVKQSVFEGTYNSDLEYLIYTQIRNCKQQYESNPSSWKPRTGEQSYTVSYEGDYVLLCVGIDDDYRPTGEYCRLDHSFESLTEAYSAWIGKWSLSDGTNTDTWTVTRKQANHSYTVTGVCGRSFPLEALLNEDGSLLFQMQKNVTTVTTSSGEVRSINFYRATASGFSSKNYTDVMTAVLDGSNPNSAALTACDENNQYYQFIGTNENNQNYNYNKRPLPATLTRVTN